MTLLHQIIQQLLSEIRHSNTMLESCMRCGGVHKRSHSKLFCVTKALELRCVDYCAVDWVQVDVAVDVAVHFSAGFELLVFWGA